MITLSSFFDLWSILSNRLIIINKKNEVTNYELNAEMNYSCIVDEFPVGMESGLLMSEILNYFDNHNY